MSRTVVARFPFKLADGTPLDVHAVLLRPHHPHDRGDIGATVIQREFFEPGRTEPLPVPALSDAEEQALQRTADTWAAQHWDDDMPDMSEG